MRRAILALLILVAMAGPARALEQDAQAWRLFTVQGHFADRWRFFGESQLRFKVPSFLPDRSLLRAAVGYDVTPAVSVWAGYGWTPTWQPDFKDEQRPWQQLLVNTRPLGGALTNRTRFEQRFVADAPLSLRVRHMTRFARPLVEGSPWLWAAYDELFVHLNDAAGVSSAGLDQNRLFVGVNRVIKQVTLEVGYLHNYYWRAEQPENKLRHALVLAPYWNLP